MRISYLITILIVIGSHLTFCQDIDKLEKKLNSFGNKKATQNNFETNFFLDMKFAAGTEHMAFQETRITYTGYSKLDTFSWISNPYLFTLASFSIEPRLNLKQLNRNQVIFLKAPTGLSFSITTKESYQMRPGFFHFQTGLLFGLAHGLHSTKTNVNNRGFAISLGVQYLRAPLFGHNIKIVKEPAISGYGADYELIDSIKKNSLLPTAQFDLYYLNKNNKPRGYSLMVSAFKSFYIKFSMIIPDKAE